MNTPIEDVIQYCIENAENIETQCGTQMIIVDYEVMRKEFSELLKKEKQMVIEAYDRGEENGACYEIIGSKKYYEETYKK